MDACGKRATSRSKRGVIFAGLLAVIITQCLRAGTPAKKRPAVAVGNREQIELIDRLKLSSVGIVAKRDQNWVQLGSGTVVYRGGGLALVITNAHVILNDTAPGQRMLTSEISVWNTQGDSLTAVPVIAMEKREEYDLGLLWVRDPSQKLPGIARCAKGVSVGERVIAIGNPINHDFFHSTGRILKKIPNGKSSWLLRHSALMEHGSSGGGLFNMKGKLVGMNTYIEGENTEGGLAFDALCEKSDPFGDQWVRVFPVQAKVGEWQASGANVRKGDVVLLMAHGRWTAGFLLTFDGSGTGGYENYRYDPGSAFGSLLMTAGESEHFTAIDQKWPTIAEPTDYAYAYYKVEEAGELKFRINDTETSNNSGALTVAIIVLR